MQNSHQPFYLIVHTDHLMDPMGPNAGAEMATLNQALFLAKRGYRVVVAAHIGLDDFERDGIEFWNLGPAYDVEMAIRRAAERGPFHLISAGKAFALFFARRCPACLSRVLITHDRTAGDSGVLPSVLNEIVDRILSVSEAQKAKIVSEGADPSLVTVIHNGVNLDLFPASPPEMHDPYRIVFAGALVYDKGLHVLLSAYMKLKAKYPKLSIDVYGSSSLWSRKEYLNIDELKRALPDVHFHGKTPQATIAEGFGRAGICVIPSLWFDPYPLISLEAQVCGCPVVAFDSGGLREGIKHGVTGWVVEDISEDGLTQALDTLLAQPELLQVMSKNCLEISRREFRWENVIDKIIQISESNADYAAYNADVELRAAHLAQSGQVQEANELLYPSIKSRLEKLSISGS